jgi:cellulose synthase/poly-beta-1,6-N-acetylglucosamine synthase-like glycosyltransferase
MKFKSDESRIMDLMIRWFMAKLLHRINMTFLSSCIVGFFIALLFSKYLLTLCFLIAIIPSIIWYINFEDKAKEILGECDKLKNELEERILNNEVKP